MKLGIIGSGMIVHDFLKTADKINNLELTAISSTVRSKDIARELANQYGIKKTYTDNEKNDGRSRCRYGLRGCAKLLAL